MTTTPSSIDLTLSPRLQRHLFGHTSQWDHLLSQYKEGRLHPAWILTGPKGIGKSTFAYKMARYILGEGSENPENAGFYNGLIDQGAHPNFLVIERQLDEDGNLAAEIKMIDIAPIREFTQQSAAFPGWRVVIIDGLEDLNRNAANALLKILEEPPAMTVFLCICPSLGQILPTIRSRCCLLPFHPLGITDLKKVMGEDQTATPLDFELANGSIGRLQRYKKIGGAAILYKTLGQLMTQSLQGRISEVIAFNGTLQKHDDRVPLILDLLSWMVRRLVLLSNGMSGTVPQDHDLHTLSQTRPSKHWLRVQEVMDKFLRISQGAHLDQGHLIEACFMMVNRPDYYEELL